MADKPGPIMIEVECFGCKHRWLAEWVYGRTCKTCPWCGTQQEVAYARPVPDKNEAYDAQPTSAAQGTDTAEQLI